MLKFLRNTNVSSIIRANSVRQEIPLLKWKYCFNPNRIENIVNWLMSAEEEKPKVKMAKPNVQTLNYLRNYRDENTANQRVWKAPVISSSKFKRISPEFMELLGHNEQKSKTHIRRKLLPENPYTYSEQVLVDRKYKNTTWEVNNNLKTNRLDLRRNPYQDMDPLELVDLLNYLLSGYSLTYTQSLRLVNILHYFTEISPEELATYLKIIHGQGVLTLESLNYLEKLLVELLSRSELTLTQANLISDAMQNAYNYDKPIQCKRPLKKLFSIVENPYGRDGMRKCISVSKTSRNESRGLSQSNTRYVNGQNDTRDENTGMMAYDICTNKVPEKMMCPSKGKLLEGVQCNIPEKDGKYTLQKISITVSYGSAERQNKMFAPIEENSCQTTCLNDDEQDTTVASDEDLLPKTLAARARHEADIFLGRKSDKSILKRDLKPTFPVKEFTTLRPQKDYRPDKTNTTDKIDGTDFSDQIPNHSLTLKETSHLDSQVEEYDSLQKRYDKRGFTYGQNFIADKSQKNEHFLQHHVAGKYPSSYNQYHKTSQLHTSPYSITYITDPATGKSQHASKGYSPSRRDYKGSEKYTSPYSQTYMLGQQTDKSGTQHTVVARAPQGQIFERRDYKPGEQYTSPYGQSSITEQKVGILRKPPTMSAPNRYAPHTRGDKPGEHYTSPYSQSSIADQNAFKSRKPQTAHAPERHSPYKSEYKSDDYTSPYSKNSMTEQRADKSHKAQKSRQAEKHSPQRRAHKPHVAGNLEDRDRAHVRAGDQLDSSFDQTETTPDRNTSTHRRDHKDKTEEEFTKPKQEIGKIFKTASSDQRDKKFDEHPTTTNQDVDKQFKVSPTAKTTTTNQDVDKQFKVSPTAKTTTTNQDVDKEFKVSHTAKTAARRRLHHKTEKKNIDQETGKSDDQLQTMGSTHYERIGFSKLTDGKTTVEKVQATELPKKGNSRRKHEMTKVQVFRTDVTTEPKRRLSPLADFRLSFAEQFVHSPFKKESKVKVHIPPAITAPPKVIAASPKTEITLPKQNEEVTVVKDFINPPESKPKTKPQKVKSAKKVRAAPSNTVTALSNSQEEFATSSPTVELDQNVGATDKNKIQKTDKHTSVTKVAKPTSKRESSVSKQKKKQVPRSSEVRQTPKSIPVVPVFYKDIQYALSQLSVTPGKFIASATELQPSLSKENVDEKQASISRSKRNADGNQTSIVKSPRRKTLQEKRYSKRPSRRSTKGTPHIPKTRRPTLLLAESYMQDKREKERAKERAKEKAKEEQRERERKRKAGKRSHKVSLEVLDIMETPTPAATPQNTPIKPNSRAFNSNLKKKADKIPRKAVKLSEIPRKGTEIAARRKSKALTSRKLPLDGPVKKSGKVIQLTEVLGTEEHKEKYTPIKKISYDNMPEINEGKQPESHKRFLLYNPEIQTTESLKENSEETVKESEETVESIDPLKRKKSLLINIKTPTSEKTPTSVGKMLEPLLSEYSENNEFNKESNNHSSRLSRSRIGSGSILNKKPRKRAITQKYSQFAAFKDTWSLNDSISDYNVHFPPSAMEDIATTSAKATTNDKDSEIREDIQVNTPRTTVTTYFPSPAQLATTRRVTEPHTRLLDSQLTASMATVDNQLNTESQAIFDSSNRSETKAVPNNKTSTALKDTFGSRESNKPIAIVQTIPTKSTKGILDKRSNVRREDLQNQSKKRLNQLAKAKSQAIFDTNYRRASFNEEKRKNLKLALEQSSVKTKTSTTETQRTTSNKRSKDIFRTADNIIKMNKSTVNSGFTEPLYVGAISAHRFSAYNYQSTSQGPVSLDDGAAGTKRKTKKSRTKSKTA